MHDDLLRMDPKWRTLVRPGALQADMARSRNSQVHGGGPLTRSRDMVLRMLGEMNF
jgi:putative AlgH/UPF0301 family transcriptional regulator